MAGRWSTTDKNGNPLTDGRLCYVIQPVDPAMPPIYIYGKDKDEIIEKASRTVETAQTEIHRLRKPAPRVPSTPAAPARGVPQEEITIATADLQNPAKSAAAVKTLLRASGFDTEAQARREALNQVARIAEEWNRVNPEFPADSRNERLLIDTAARLAGGRHLIKAEHLDAGYAQMIELNMIFDPQPESETPVQPEGTRDSRTAGRTATTYRRNQLRSEAPVVTRGDTPKQAEWRKIHETGTSRDIANALRLPGYVDFINKEYAAKSA